MIYKVTARPASHERGAAEALHHDPTSKAEVGHQSETRSTAVDATTKPNNTQSKMATEAQKGTFAVKVGLAQVR